MNAKIITTILVLLFVAAVSSWRVRPSYNRQCANQAWCGRSKRNGCCKSNVRPIGKRSLRSWWWHKPPMTGVCSPFGGEGSSCLVDLIINPDATYHICPCTARLVCVDSGVKDIPLGRMGTCQRRCKRNSDCGFGKCCQNDPQVKGRRKRSDDLWEPYGVCTPYGTLGSSCVFGTDPLINSFHARCPCVGNLECVDGDGQVPIQFGTCG